MKSSYCYFRLMPADIDFTMSLRMGPSIGDLPRVFEIPSMECGHKRPPIHMIPYILVISNRIDHYNVVILILGCAHVSLTETLRS